MQNVVTIFALSVWPFVSIILFVRLPLHAAVAWTILGGQLLLPVGATIKFTMVPGFDKATIPSLCILVGCLLSGAKRAGVRKMGLIELLLAIAIFGPIATSELNGDTLFFGDRVIAGVGLYDAISAVQIAAISLIPFFVGRRYFRDEASNIVLFKALVSGMAAYSLLLLFEVRFSPQLHNWVYGYHPSDFVQAVRSGEFRPMAFMGHGLIAAKFVLLALLASVSLWMSSNDKREFRRFSVLFAVMIYFCRTLAVFLYAAILVPLIALVRLRFQIRVAVLIASLALLYPTMRTLDIFPTKTLLESARSVSEDRAQSLQVRFDNEDQLLAHALQRPWFGWGRYGRSRIYNEYGKDISVTDGQWIITLGQFGVFGFVAQFGLLSIGIFRARRAMSRTATPRDRYLLSALALMMAVIVIDLLPNSGLEPWTWLMCGALVGRTDALLTGRSGRPSQATTLPT
ncbi:hypothetical protein [Tardiphaga robiniae]|uniref:O-antigen ligase family protein n=1 Tax=Tardiphaga robiniae TaxID=943830 RepID=A0A7G6TUK5_9BRAD|nr:hypothetical protein [Tardiphaga robiniae]QND70437.1 hypothetical protein HB776_03630 [Tardiphaga robiniae]